MRGTLLSALTASVCLGACAHSGVSAPPHNTIERIKPTDASPWREDFGDPILRDLLDRADISSLDVKRALARLDRADAELKIAHAGASPLVVIGAGAAVGGVRNRSVRARGLPSIAGAYEWDLWGRLDLASQGARADRAASADEVAAARLLIGAETARTYFQFRASEASITSLVTRRDLADRVITLVQARRTAGLGGGDDIEGRRHALAEIDTQLIEARLQARLLAIRLGTLLGSSTPLSPQPQAKPWPEPGPLIPIPSDIVARRFDVTATFHRLQAADARRAEAVAASRPRFIINLSGGSTDPGTADLLNARSLIWAAAVALSHTAYDGGVEKGRIRSAGAEADLADLAYRSTLLNAWSEAQVAMSSAQAADAALDIAQTDLEGATRALARAKARHQDGLASGIDMALAEDQREVAGMALAAARYKAVAARLDLALAAPSP